MAKKKKQNKQKQQQRKKSKQGQVHKQQPQEFTLDDLDETDLEFLNDLDGETTKTKPL